MPYTISGVLWYQGESNSRLPKTYRTLFSDLIKAWRKGWGQGDFPFIFAQLSSFQDRSWSLVKGQAWAWQRDAQAYGLNEPNTEMIATHDVGEMHDIHPQDKMTVGKRFAQMVAKNAGEKVVAHGPKFKSFVVKGQSIIISFENTYGGLMTKEVRMNHNAKIAPGKDPKAHRASSTELVGFVICGENKTFHEAKAVIKDDKVIVSSPKVSKPLAVRYAWKTFALANLYNKEGLPAYQFRTDNFIMPVIYNAK